MKIISISNNKGGVGKTSTAVCLAYLAACDGYKTLLWDLDPQAAASFCYRIKPKVKGGVKSISRSYKVHLDGYSLLPYFSGKSETAERKEIFYFSDDGDLTALRYNDWKAIFMEQKATGTLRVWQEPFVPLRVPFIFNLRRDPFEQAQITSNTYYDWLLDRTYLLVPAQTYVGNFLSTFKEFPPRQKAASFSLDQLMENLNTTIHN